MAPSRRGRRRAVARNTTEVTFDRVSPTAPFDQCGVRLIRQNSRKAACVAGLTFGCQQNGSLPAHEMWVSAGCRGFFECAGRRLYCGSLPDAPTSCACTDVSAVNATGGRAAARQPPSTMAILAVVSSDSSMATRQRLLASMRHVDATHATHRARVDWAFVVYDELMAQWSHFLTSARELRHSSFVRVIDASEGRARRLTVSQRRARFVHAHTGVTSVWRSLGTNTSHDAVWLMDSDIMLDGFSLSSFLRKWQCAFSSPPVISQPPIRNDAIPRISSSGRPRGRQTFLLRKASAAAAKPFQNNGDTYRTCLVGEMGASFGAEACFLRDALALRTAWVEQQCALVDARFLAWFFAQAIVQRVLSLQLRFRVDSGPDAIWCGAAAEWAAARNTDRPACAVLTEPIGHDDGVAQDKSPHSMRSYADKNKMRGHVDASFNLLDQAGIRMPLRWALGRQCVRHNCSRHRWFLFSPQPGWKLPRDEAGLRQVHACSVLKERRELCRTGGPFLPEGERPRRRRVECDGMLGLYWREHLV